MYLIFFFLVFFNEVSLTLTEFLVMAGKSTSTVSSSSLTTSRCEAANLFLGLNIFFVEIRTVDFSSEGSFLVFVGF